MTNPNYVEIHADIGNAWDAIDGTTTTIVQRHIDRARAVIKNITGTTAGNMQDISIRALADAFAVQNAMAGLGPESVNLDAYEMIRDRFYEDARNALNVKGYSLDGKYIRFTQVNP